MIAHLLLVLGAATPQTAGPDTVVLHADGPPVWGAAPTLVEELRIGTVDGDERYALGEVSGALLTPEGQVWVGDRQLGSIRRYSPEGVHVGDSGRRGEGPGETNYLMDLRLLPDGRVAVFDPLNIRIHLFDREGEFDSDVRVPVRGVFGWDQNFEVDSAGWMYAVQYEPPTGGTRVGKARWIRLDLDGTVADTIPFVPSDRRGVVDPVRTWTALSPLGGTVVGRNDRYAFTWDGREGQVVQLVRSGVEPVEYERSERREAQRLEDVFAERNAVQPRRIPREKPFWSSLTVDVEGRLWIQRHPPGEPVEETEAQRATRVQYDNPERTWGEAVVFDVIHPDGRLLGTLRFPNSASASPVPRVELAYARGDEVLAIERGEFDEQYVVKYRIVPGG